MSTKWIWRILLGLSFLMIAGGCSSVSSSKDEDTNSLSSTSSPVLSLFVDGKEVAGSTDKLFKGAYRKGMTLRELLVGSCVVVFDEDGQQILSVNEISLDPEIGWELQVNGMEFFEEQWDKPVAENAQIMFRTKHSVLQESSKSVILIVNGGSDQPELTHSYVMPFSEDLTIRRMLQISGRVLLAENNRAVLSVMGYTPLSSEIWRLKVNGKQLMENGLDMKLRPQDELEIRLDLR